MSIILGIALFTLAGCAAAILVSKACWWASGPHDDAAEMREQAAWLCEHYKRGCNNDQGGALTQARVRLPE